MIKIHYIAPIPMSHAALPLDAILSRHLGTIPPIMAKSRGQPHNNGKNFLNFIQSNPLPLLGVVPGA